MTVEEKISQLRELFADARSAQGRAEERSQQAGVGRVQGAAAGGERRPGLGDAAGGQLYSFGDLCTCAGAGSSCPLSGGLLTVTTIMCQCHGSEFHITTGAVIRGPARHPLPVYETQVTGGPVGIRP
jgi:nitrite reductase/ring-hydroxylating ferredoxin subunit